MTRPVTTRIGDRVVQSPSFGERLDRLRLAIVAAQGCAFTDTQRDYAPDAADVLASLRPLLGEAGEQLFWVTRRLPADVAALPAHDDDALIELGLDPDPAPDDDDGE